jgi:hypothetical protein
VCLTLCANIRSIQLLPSSVCQMSLLEVEESAGGIAHGVVLVLVGAESQSPGAKDSDLPRSLRMYNLASLINLAKWAVAEKVSVINVMTYAAPDSHLQGARPLDLHRTSNWQAQTPPRRHKRETLARGLETLIGASLTHPSDQPAASYSTLLLPSPVAGSSANVHPKPTNEPTPGRLSPNRRNTTSSWDVVEDQPLRWATDFVPLATSGSRLSNATILSYALWTDDSRKGRGGRLLAVATKNNILLYETPKGERAFRFVKASCTCLACLISFSTFCPGVLHSTTPSKHNILPTVRAGHIFT